eukprot:4538632-Amphidinium_carterae.2
MLRIAATTKLVETRQLTTDRLQYRARLPKQARQARPKTMRTAKFQIGAIRAKKRSIAMIPPPKPSSDATQTAMEQKWTK